MKVMYRLSGLILLVFALQSNILISAKTQAFTNIEIIEKIAIEKTKLIIKDITGKKIDTIYVPIAIQESKLFLNSFFIKYADSAGIKVIIPDKEEMKKPYLDFSAEIMTVYSAYAASGDSLIRTISFRSAGELIEKNGVISPINTGNKVFQDTIGRDAAEKFNSTDYKFAKSEIPERPRTFWSEIVQPVAFIGAAIVTVVLLFTVRSK